MRLLLLPSRLEQLHPRSCVLQPRVGEGKLRTGSFPWSQSFSWRCSSHSRPFLGRSDAALRTNVPNTVRPPPHCL